MSATRVKNAPLVDYSWQFRGACVGLDADLFLGPDGEHPRDRTRRESRALLVCNDCPVLDACLKHAVELPERHGVWGGSTPEQRLWPRAGEPRVTRVA